MLFLLVSLAVFSAAAWGQTNNCPDIRFVQASQQTLLNTTSQIRDMLSRQIQQQSTSESLTSLLQLSLARQLMVDLDNKPATNPTSPGNSCDCNKIETTLNQLKAQSDNLTIRMEAEFRQNKEAIVNLTTDNERLMVQSAEYREAISNLTINNEILQIRFEESIKVIHNLTTDNKRLNAESVQNKEAIFNLTINNERLKALSMDNSETLRNLTATVEGLQMHQVCGSSGWTRVAYLNMTNPSEQCPTGFRLYNQNGVRACGRPAGSGGCLSSVQFPVGMTYSEVCGRVTGYQYWGPDAFRATNIDQVYVEGVSLTHGSPRKHIWSFAAGYSLSINKCPCSTSSGIRPPSFVGNDYYCETGYTGSSNPTNQLYPEPLWDGKGCSSQEAQCCRAAGIPWFHKRLNTSTNDYIELRICASNPSNNNEDIPVGFYEIYVK